MEEAEDLEEGRGSKRGTNGCEVEVWSMSAKEERIVGDERRKEKERQKVIYHCGLDLTGVTRCVLGRARRPIWVSGAQIERVLSVRTRDCQGRRHFAGKAGRLPRWSHQCD